MSNRAGIRKRESNSVTIHKPPKEEGKFYFCNFIVDDLHHFKAVTDLTDSDIIVKAKRKIKAPKKIKVSISKTYKSL